MTDYDVQFKLVKTKTFFIGECMISTHSIYRVDTHNEKQRCFFKRFNPAISKQHRLLSRVYVATVIDR